MNTNAKIYLIKCYNYKEVFLKLGYTKNSIKKRFKEMPYKYKVLRVLKTKDAELIETSIHKLLKNERFIPFTKFAGYTECYDMNMFKKINTLLNQTLGIKPKPLKEYHKKEITNSKGQLDYVDLSMYRF
jgi:hypothetical protein